ncbi:kinectin-like [Sphaeramia orbicularis]|uniref:kinectin-like n=1 Tax=Sphaeramia orbicularis TaxID=375764 RepID=UPI00117E6A1D|nr:kinectin-like [Sphaeramia orbicularis]
MDFTECQMISTEMLEKIAELDHSRNQLRELNSEMRRWLDVADEDMAVLRSENSALKKQVKDLEKMVHNAQQDEAESCRALLADDLDIKRRNEEKIQTLEQESAILKEENKKLTAENFELQQQQDKMSLNTLKTSLQTLEKLLELKHAEETVEEYSTIIKDLKLTNQKLREQVEAGQLELSLAAVNDPIGAKEGSVSPLSFADEIKQLASFTDVITLTADLREPQHEEAEAEELPKPPCFTVDPQTKRCAGVLDTVFHKLTQFLLCLFILTLLAFVASGCFTGNSFTDTLWNNAQLMLKPYVRVHYGCLPPV